jgi:cytochrome c peroxidase
LLFGRRKDDDPNDGIAGEASCRPTGETMDRPFLIIGLLASLGLIAACGDQETGQETMQDTMPDTMPYAMPDTTQTESISSELSLGGGPALGARLFFNEFPNVHGNGRTCNTCHVAEDGFQLTPAHVEARWQALQKRKHHHPKADDPLFRSIDADDFDQDFTTLRQHGLVRVTIQMAPNVRVLDDPTARTVSLWRSTPTVFNVAITAPYQLDGRVPTLQLQALGALHGHAQIRDEPPARLLDAVAAFQKLIFPNQYSFEVAQAVENGMPIPPEPPLSGAAVQGKVVFERECSFCHSGPALNQQLIPDLFLGDILVSKPVPPFADPTTFLPSPPLPVRMWAVTLPDGSEMVRPSTDPGRVLITGNPQDFNGFEISQLRGVSKIAPYFHDNSAKTLQDVGKHYQALFVALRAGGIPVGFINDDEIEPLAAYLSTL